MLTGNCLCGQVRYEVHGPLGPVFHCHCISCRKAQGGAFGSNAPLNVRDLKLVAGREHIAEFESSPGKKRCFCRNCGSPLWSRRDADPQTLRLRLGLINQDPGCRPLGHVWTGEKAPWFEIEGSLPQAHDDGAALKEKLAPSS